MVTRTQSDIAFSEANSGSVVCNLMPNQSDDPDLPEETRTS